MHHFEMRENSRAYQHINSYITRYDLVASYEAWKFLYYPCEGAQKHIYEVKMRARAKKNSDITNIWNFRHVVKSLFSLL